MIETKFINLKVNDQLITVQNGDRLLSAIKKSKKSVPTLCYDERLDPQGTCRMCLIEIKRNDKLEYVASCTYLAEEGLEIYTHSETCLLYTSPSPRD